jgi:hypothetical protein
MLTVVMLSMIMLNVIMLSVIMLSVIMLNAIMLSVFMLNVFMLSVVGNRANPTKIIQLVTILSPFSARFEPLNLRLRVHCSATSFAPTCSLS